MIMHSKIINFAVSYSSTKKSGINEQRNMHNNYTHKNGWFLLFMLNGVYDSVNYLLLIFIITSIVNIMQVKNQTKQ